MYLHAASTLEATAQTERSPYSPASITQTSIFHSSARSWTGKLLRKLQHLLTRQVFEICDGRFHYRCATFRHIEKNPCSGQPPSIAQAIRRYVAVRRSMADSTGQAARDGIGRCIPVDFQSLAAFLVLAAQFLLDLKKRRVARN